MRARLQDYLSHLTLAKLATSTEANIKKVSVNNAILFTDGGVAMGRWDGRRNRPVPDAVWLEQHRRALPFVLKRENERGGAVAPRLVCIFI